MPKTRDIQFTAIKYANEWWFFTWDDPDQLANVVGRFAADPDLAFDWRCAGLVMREVRRVVEETCTGR